MDEAAFEAMRLRAFRARGFDADGRRLADAAGRTTYALVRGACACPTILVHGGLADASVWATVAPHLPGAVVIPDRPGHGLSSDVDYARVPVRDHAAAWVRGVLDALGVDQADLVGNSIGGFFVLAFAIAEPARVRRLALVGAPAGIDRRVPWLLRLWAAPGLGRAVGARMPRTTDAMRRRVLPGLTAHPERVPEDLVQLAVAAMARPGWPRMARSLLHALLDLGGWRNTLAIRDEVAGLATPTLFAWGDRDAYTPAVVGRRLARRMSTARVEVIPDAGHVAMLDQPTAVAASLTRFLGAAAPDARTSGVDLRPRP